MTRNTSSTERPGNYLLEFDITSANNITPYLFVKQRVILSDGTKDDSFVTVASLPQIEDINQLVPAKDSTYFRDSTITLISSDPDLLQNISDDIIADLQLTLSQLDELDDIAESETITITPSSVTVS